MKELSNFVISDSDVLGLKNKSKLNLDIFSDKVVIDEYLSKASDIISKQDKLFNDFKISLEKKFKTSRCIRRHILWDKIIKRIIYNENQKYLCKYNYDFGLKNYCFKFETEKYAVLLDILYMYEDFSQLIKKGK